MQMIGGRKELGFQMHMFQKLEPLKKFAEQKPIQILLIGEEYSQEERLEIPAAERFVLVKQKGGIWQTKKRSFISISQLIRF